MLRSWLPLVLKAIITISLIAWLFQRVDLRPFIDRFARIDLALAFAAIAMMMVQLLLTGWRWWLVGCAIGAPLARPIAFRLTLIGQFFNQTLPSAIGGDAIRAWFATREGIPLAKAIGSVFADRIIAMVMLVAIVAATLPLFFARITDSAPRLGIGVLVGGTAVGVAIFLGLGERVAALLQRHRLTRPLAHLVNDVRAVLVGPTYPLSIGVASIVVHLGVIVSAWLAARALSLDVTLIDCLLLIPPIVVLTMLPISIAGWGVRESATVVGFGFLGVSASDALALSVAFGLVQIAVGLPGGAVWLAQRRPADLVSENGRHAGP